MQSGRQNKGRLTLDLNVHHHYHYPEQQTPPVRRHLGRGGYRGAYSIYTHILK